MDFHGIQHACMQTALGVFNCQTSVSKKDNKHTWFFVTYEIFDHGSDVAKRMERRADAMTSGGGGKDPFTPRATSQQKTLFQKSSI